jgi:hypothetical protein
MWWNRTGQSSPASYHKEFVQQTITKVKIMYKHHTYTFSHYSSCAHTDQLRAPYDSRWS